MDDHTPSTRDDILESFKKYLASEGLRVTNQRIAIFDAAFAMPDHFTADDLLDAARKIDRSVSRATVYRSIPILIESSVIREVDVAKEHKFYATNHDVTTFKAQVICTECEKIYEIDAPFMEWYGKSVADKLDMEIVSRRLQVTARCRKGKKCPDKRSREIALGA
ncbi:MAG: transcriptional repressor [Opitutales bacterium]|nr:transcriptional repressor [Opitutales bacterium]